MTLSIIVPVLYLAASAAVGGMLWRLFRLLARRGEYEFSCVALGMGVLSLVLFAAGAGGRLYAGLAWALILVPIVLFHRAAWGILAGIRRTAMRAVRARGGFNRLLAATVVLVFVLGFLSSLAPPTESDAMTVHLLVPREYAAAHRMIYEPDNWDSAMAMGPHLAYAAVMLASGGDVAPAVLHFLTGFIFILFAWQFVRRRFGKSAAYAAAAVLAPMPMIMHLVIAPMADMFFGLYALAALVWLIDALQRKSGASFGLSAVFAALSATAKYGGLVTILTVFAVAVLARVMLWDSRIRLLKSAVAVAAAAVLIASPFYIRNYLWTGNPVFPTMKKVFGGPGWNEPSWDAGAPETPRDAKLTHTLHNMILAPWYMTIDAREISSGESEMIGPAFLVFLPLALLLRSRRKLILYLGLYCIVAYVLIYWTSPRPRGRYFIAIMPVLAAFVGAGLAFLYKYVRPAFHLGRLVVLITAASGLAVATIYSVSFVMVVFHLTPRDAFLSRSVDFYDECLWMKENLPAGARVLVQGTNNLYYFPQSSMRLEASSDYTHCDSAPLFGLDASGSPETALARMGDLGITHVFTTANYVSERNPSTSGHILRILEQRGYIEKIHEARSARGTRNPILKQRQESVALYEVKYDAGGRS